MENNACDHVWKLIGDRRFACVLCDKVVVTHEKRRELVDSIGRHFTPAAAMYDFSFRLSMSSVPDAIDPPKHYLQDDPYPGPCKCQGR